MLATAPKPTIAMRLVMIEWLDAFGCSSEWQELSADYRPQPILCRSVGWLFRDEPDYKVIIPHMATLAPNHLRQGCGDMTIPVNAIRHMYDLTEPTETDDACDGT